MRLQVKPYHTNTFPLSGMLIRGNSIYQWLQQLQGLETDLQQFPVYAIAGNTPNSLWGCFVPLPPAQWEGKFLDANEPCQCVHHNLYIPQYATVYPFLGAQEAAKLFPAAPHLLHPEVGLVALDTPVDWSTLLALPPAVEPLITAPLPAVFIPAEIHGIEIRTLSPEEVIKTMEENMFPKSEKFTDKPLHLGEKIKLGLLKLLFSASKDGNGSSTHEKTFLTGLIEKIAGSIGMGNSRWVQNLQESLEDLERRNQSEMDRLMDMFKNNPEEALKHAIPLDADGVTRGGNLGRFELSKRWNSFDLFGRSGYGSGSSVLGSDSFRRLQEQYEQTAQLLIQQKDYKKAAFVYMKLLKNNSMAAKTLEDGGLYPEAASVYLQYLKDKNKAAECYEKGQMITDAIALYKELDQHEKVGDLYMLQQKKEAAFEHYTIVADDYIANSKYLKASLLYRNKMGGPAPAQALLLKGWREDRDAFNCINNYFQNIPDKQALLEAIEYTYEKDTSHYNKPLFLTALRYELKKDAAIATRATEMAYEIVAELAATQPDIVAELKYFNNDKSLVKDVMRYKAQRRNQ